MKAIVLPVNCYHCGNECPDPPIQSEDKSFCCAGCCRVYSILHQHQLDNYYCLNQAPGIVMRSDTAGPQWNILDDPAQAAIYTSFSNKDLVKASFYLPQIHCSSCLWLLENLSAIEPGIIQSHVEFSEKRIYFSFNPNLCTLKQIALLLQDIGYEPYLSVDEKSRTQRIKNNLSLEIGISGFCFANIMLLSFPEYFGLNLEQDGQLVYLFRYLNLFLGIPVFLVGVNIFFKKSWQGLIQGYLNIDAPIALAILVTFIRSSVEIISGSGMGYLDSMSGIIFFMIVGRAIQEKTNRALNFDRDYKAYFPIGIQTVLGAEIKTIPVSEIQKDQIILLRPNEVLPVDGILSKGQRNLDYSFITGESRPVVVSPGDLVYAGGKILDTSMEMIALKTFNQSEFIQLWNNETFKKETGLKNYFTDQLSKYFSTLVLLIAAGVFVYWQLNDPSKSWGAATGILIVACPCALLLSTSFIYGHLIKQFAGAGFFVKNASVLENLPRVNHVVFDKTGTLTHPGEDQIQVKQQSWTAEEKWLVLSLMSHSFHPMSQLILRKEGLKKTVEIDFFKEHPGGGIEGWARDHHLLVGNREFTGASPEIEGYSQVIIKVDQVVKAIYEIQPSITLAVGSFLNRLKTERLTMLSGDKVSLKSNLQPHLPKHMKLLLGQSPQQKLEFIQRAQNQGDTVMMVGDGLNDAGALKQSDIGVAVVDHSFSFSPACDILLQSNKLTSLDDFITKTKQARVLIWISFAYSVMYNIAGIYFAAQGLLNPMIAAILMPLSSIGVMLWAYLGTAWIGRTKLN